MFYFLKILKVDKIYIWLHHEVREFLSCAFFFEIGKFILYIPFTIYIMHSIFHHYVSVMLAQNYSKLSLLTIEHS